ncbi:MAG: SAM-dependent methyltransferase, partial [Myxococcales bacterium]|nr:SAM-dependent methyltransferase [Myxococcales bacterium]
IIHRAKHSGASIAQSPTPRDDNSRDNERTRRKRAATLCHVGRHEFDPAALKVVPEWPLVYWWDARRFESYASAPLFGELAPAAKGICTSDDVRYMRRSWEVPGVHVAGSAHGWVPSIHGAKDERWFEPLNLLLTWRANGLQNKVMHEFRWGSHSKRVQNQHYYFRLGVAFSMIGANFSARAHRYPSVFGDKGSSVFPSDRASALCSMNSSESRAILESLNPSISFQVGDVNRLPLFPIADADEIFAQIEAAFSIHEAHREPSVEFKQPGPSPWRHAQDWAQLAVDRPAETPLPEYVEELDPEPPTDHLSYALGVALGRFAPDGTGILDPSTADLSHALPAGILFLDSTLDREDHRDSLGHPACEPLISAWRTYSRQLDTKRKSLR